MDQLTEVCTDQRTLRGKVASLLSTCALKRINVNIMLQLYSVGKKKVCVDSFSNPFKPDIVLFLAKAKCCSFKDNGFEISVIIWYLLNVVLFSFGKPTLTSRFQVAQFNVEHFSGMHNWYACSHARPTFCNVCRESLSGVTSHGLSCEGTVASRVRPPSTLSLQ